MRRVALVALILVVTGVAFGDVPNRDEEPEKAITHGEFCQLVLKMLTMKGEPDYGPAVALSKLQEIEIVPSEWLPDDLLTQGELADFLKFCDVKYKPYDVEAPVSFDFAEAMLRRNLRCIEAYRGMVLGHGNSDGTSMDEGVDRAVSPSRFQ